MEAATTTRGRIKTEIRHKKRIMSRRRRVWERKFTVGHYVLVMAAATKGVEKQRRERNSCI